MTLSEQRLGIPKSSFQDLVEEINDFMIRERNGGEHSKPNIYNHNFYTSVTLHRISEYGSLVNFLEKAY